MRIMNEIKTLWKNDQKERYIYSSYLNTYDTWEEAYLRYCIDHGPFTDYSARLKVLLEDCSPEEFDEGTWVAVWGLGQHADTDVNFQIFILGLIEVYKGKNWAINKYNQPAYEYLHDRINVNLGRSQLYNTQRVDLKKSG